jgi:hypothetical protein
MADIGLLRELTDGETNIITTTWSPCTNCVVSTPTAPDCVWPCQTSTANCSPVPMRAFRAPA